jgi:hypothetical protein
MSHIELSDGQPILYSGLWGRCEATRCTQTAVPSTPSVLLPRDFATSPNVLLRGVRRCCAASTPLQPAVFDRVDPGKMSDILDCFFLQRVTSSPLFTSKLRSKISMHSKVPTPEAIASIRPCRQASCCASRTHARRKALLSKAKSLCDESVPLIGANQSGLYESMRFRRMSKSPEGPVTAAPRSKPTGGLGGSEKSRASLARPPIINVAKRPRSGLSRRAGDSGD